MPKASASYCTRKQHLVRGHAQQSLFPPHVAVNTDAPRHQDTKTPRHALRFALLPALNLPTPPVRPRVSVAQFASRQDKGLDKPPARRSSCLGQLKSGVDARHGNEVQPGEPKALSSRSRIISIPAPSLQHGTVQAFPIKMPTPQTPKHPNTTSVLSNQIRGNLGCYTHAHLHVIKQ